MTMDVAMGPVSGILPRGGDRHGKAGRDEAGAFDDALAGSSARQPAKHASGGREPENTDGTPPWRHASWVDGIDLRMPHAPVPDPNPDAAPDLLGDASDGTGLAAADAGFGLMPLPLQAASDDAADETADAALAGQETANADRTGTIADDGRSTAAPLPGTTAEGEAVLRRNGHPATPDAASDGERRRAAPERGGAVPPTATSTSAAERPTAPAEVRFAGADGPPRSPEAAMRGAQADAGTPPFSGQTGADAGGPRVSVLGFSSSTSPVLPFGLAPAGLAAALSPTSAGVVAALAAEPAWRSAAAEAATQRGNTAPGGVSSLRIQLNPAELGMVTARLVATGSQLEIEIRVESGDARQRLAADADAIVKALRGVGYDVERVTIQQAPQGSAAAQQQGASSRDSFMQGGQERAGADAGGNDGGDDEQGRRGQPGAAHRGPGEAAARHSGGGVYI